MNNNDLTHVLHINDFLVTDLVTKSGSTTNNHLVQFVDGTIQDSGLLVSTIIQSSGPSTQGHMALFADTSGVLLEDGGLPNFLSSSGGTVTGPIDLSTNDLLNVGHINSIPVNDLVSLSTSVTTGHLATFNNSHQVAQQVATYMLNVAREKEIDRIFSNVN